MNTNDLPGMIETQMSKTMLAISQAASKPDCDLAELEALTKRASELKEMKQQVAAIMNNLLSMDSKLTFKTSASGSRTFLRELLIEVSQGMINQNLLTLTEPIKRGQVKVGEEMDIEALPSGDKFTSVVMQPGNKLQERGAVGKFYRDAKVRDGDDVILREVERGRWQLFKMEPSVR